MFWIERCFRISGIAVFTTFRAVKVVIRGIINKGKGDYFYKETKCWANELLHLTGTEVIINGLENINKGEAYIYIANHTNLLDIPILINALSIDKINFMYRASLQKVPMLGFALKHSPFIPIIRENTRNSKAGIEQANKTLQDSGSVIIFPEGTRSKTGEIAKFKRGAFMLATLSNKRIVPISISGVEKITPPDNGLRLNKGKVVVKIGKPISNIPNDRNELLQFIEHIRNMIIKMKCENIVIKRVIPAYARMTERKKKNMQPIIEYIKTKPYIIAAHRGASGLFLENTPLAFKKAIEMGADIIELDVQFTKDSKLICFHDAYINDICISDINYSDLSASNPVLLTDVLEEFGNKVYFIIEVKFLRPYTDKGMKQLMYYLRTLNLFDSVVIASITTRPLNKIKYNSIRFARTINAAMIYSDRNINTNKKYYDGVICSIDELDKVIISGIFDSNFIGVYGINSFEDVEKCKKYNIKLIGTDYPDKIRKYAEELYEKK